MVKYVRKKKYGRKWKKKGIKGLPLYSFKRDTVTNENVIEFDSIVQASSTWTSALHESINQPSGSQQSAWRMLSATSLSNVINYQELTALFGLYKINCIVYKLTPDLNITQPGATGGGSAQIQVQTVFDPSSQITESSTQDDFLQIQNCKKRNLIVSDLSKPISFKFTPTLRSVVQVNDPWDTTSHNGVSIAESKKSGWLSTAEPFVSHLGPEFAFTTVDGTHLDTSGLRIRVEKCVYLSLKQVR